jgi:tyrosine-protein phosphatase non-receptor type 23
MTTTPMSPLISVPLKTTSNVDFTSTLSQTIQTIYQESPSTYTNEIQLLNRIRQDALRGSPGSDQTHRDLLYKYFGQLELLELRFQEIRLPFEWKDAFTGKAISQMSLAYEKAGTIFNMASVLSLMAQTCNRLNQDGVKRCFNFLKSAAGVFNYINENFLHAPSIDLSKDVVKVLVNIMLAQAAEVFLETLNKPTATQLNLRSRISQLVFSQYSGLIEDVKDLVTRSIFDRTWSLLIQAKAKYFSSLAQFTKAQSIQGDANKIGEAITRLQVAEGTIKEANRFGVQFQNVFIPSALSPYLRLHNLQPSLLMLLPLSSI